MVTGGHSAPGVNEMQGLPIKLIGNVLGSIIPGLETLGDITDSVLKNIYEDTFLAFAAIKSPIRAIQAGWNPLEEQFVAAPGKSYTLSMGLTLARGFYSTRDKSSHEFDIGTGAPYILGENGQGHFTLGDRIGAEVPQRNGLVVVEQVQRITLKYGPDKSCGDVASEGCFAEEAGFVDDVPEALAVADDVCSGPWFGVSGEPAAVGDDEAVVVADLLGEVEECFEAGGDDDPGASIADEGAWHDEVRPVPWGDAFCPCAGVEGVVWHVPEIAGDTEEVGEEGELEHVDGGAEESPVLWHL